LPKVYSPIGHLILDELPRVPDAVIPDDEKLYVPDCVVPDNITLELDVLDACSIPDCVVPDNTTPELDVLDACSTPYVPDVTSHP